MNVAQMLGFYQGRQPASRSRANPEPKAHKDFLVTQEKLKAAIGTGSVTADMLVARLKIKKNYASRVLREGVAAGYLEEDGTMRGDKGTRPLKLYKVKS